MKTILITSLILAVASASHAITTVKDAKELAPVTCEAGEAISFSLEAVTPMPDKKQLVGVFPQEPDLSAPSEGYNIRLDICFVDETRATLKRLLVPSERNGLDVYTPEDSTQFEVRGLAAALFQNTGDLSIDVLGRGMLYGRVIRGFKRTNSDATATLVASATAQISPNGRLVPDAYAMVGSLVQGDAFANLRCRIGAKSRETSLEIGTATFKFDYCTFGDVGETMGYEILTVEVSDKNETIPEDLRAKPFSFTGDALKAQFAYRFNHHNACDSFVLKVPQTKATYALTTAPLAGCGMIIPGAPVRKWDEPQDRRLQYRIDYQGRSGEVQKGPEGHYLKLY